uniref:Uncharacterized protein n=2 Tax=Enterobacteriaceae TaxID=543 RepID=A0A6G6ANV9_KLEPN|nr:hypothetical protein [Enterobacter hormaechei]QID23649.1 hypothetical protein [Klebsiella pneumoniae]UFD95356.1 hypothetical protein [Escherichia coli]UFD95803.1 hypothetical protein [Escherichia coli]
MQGPVVRMKLNLGDFYDKNNNIYIIILIYIDILKSKKLS